MGWPHGKYTWNWDSDTIIKRWAAIRHYANQPACPLWSLSWGPTFMTSYRGVNICSAKCLNSVLNVKAVVAAVNQASQAKALARGSFEALVPALSPHSSVVTTHWARLARSQAVINGSKQFLSCTNFLLQIIQWFQFQYQPRLTMNENHGTVGNHSFLTQVCRYL